MDRQDTLVFKICMADAWRAAEAAGSYGGSADDLRDGFIHLSTAAQVEGTLARHFAGRDGLILLAVDVAALGTALRFEPSRGGALFPHLYGPLPLSAVIRHAQIGVGSDGRHMLPEFVADGGAS